MFRTNFFFMTLQAASASGYGVHAKVENLVVRVSLGSKILQDLVIPSSEKKNTLNKHIWIFVQPSTLEQIC
jgi:hypothetical protein